MRALLVVLALLLAFTGCFGRGAQEAPAGTHGTTSPTNATHNVTLPDRPGVCNGCVETNKTENGTGGIDHKHDYWKGRDQAVLYQANVGFGPTPVFPDGQGSSAKGVAYVKLPNSSQVYEGTEKVIVRGTALSCALGTQCQPASNAPNFFFQYRSAADATWRDPIAIPANAPIEIKVKPQETDMPHSVLSLWVFRITTDRVGNDIDALNLTITAVKGREVVNWPGHPDFYADSNVRKVADKPVKTHMTGIVGSFLYDQGGTWASPDHLISYGTSKLLVIVNVTGVSSQTGQAPTGFFLEVHNATVIGPEVVFGTRYSEKDKKNDLKSYQFEVPVNADGMDGPYQPTSRWGFRAMATFADAPVALPAVGKIGLCPGCFDYDIEYTLTVLAIHEKDAAGIMA